MTPGKLARRILGSRFEPVAALYRRVFVDMDKVADTIAAALPHGARCLDVGGGDGSLAKMLLARRPDLRITLIDLNPEVGGFLEPALRERVELRPATTMADVAGEGFRCDAVILADVVHHVPEAARASFVRDLARLCETTGSRVLIIKDLQPGSFRAWLGRMSDHHVTGDREVVFIRHEDLRAAMESALGPGRVASVEASYPDAPNYCLSIRLQVAGGAAAAV